MRAIVGFTLIAIGCSIAPYATGQVYRCTEGGKTVYSDRPCPRAATLNIPAAPRTAEPAPINPQSEANMGRIIVGQSPRQVETAWGRPKAKNVDTGASGRTEQWVYERQGGTAYVYFREGVVSSLSERVEGAKSPSPEPAPAHLQLTRAELEAQERAERAGERKHITENSRLGSAQVRERIGEPESKSFVGNLECWYYGATPLDWQTSTRLCFSASGYLVDVQRKISR